MLGDNSALVRERPMDFITDWNKKDYMNKTVRSKNASVASPHERYNEKQKTARNSDRWGTCQQETRKLYGEWVFP